MAVDFDLKDAEWLEIEVLSQIHLLFFGVVDISPDKLLFPF